MADFAFIKNTLSGAWVIQAPKRCHRPNTNHAETICPFCPEFAKDEVYRVGGKEGDANWLVLVKKNKYPFTLFHEVVIHSPDHNKNFDALPFAHVELILETYQQRYNALQNKGQVLIFHNRGHEAGESQPHPHSQIAVVPSHVKLEIASIEEERSMNQKARLITDHFELVCPESSEWPDEVWIVPRRANQRFGDISQQQITDLAFALTRVIQLYDLRHGHEFPFNFYIAPGKAWYLRLVPRIKILGGFEIASNVMVNTQEPRETLEFLKEHFWKPDREKIQTHQQAWYRKKV